MRPFCNRIHNLTFSDSSDSSSELTPAFNHRYTVLVQNPDLLVMAVSSPLGQVETRRFSIEMVLKFSVA